MKCQSCNWLGAGRADLKKMGPFLSNIRHIVWSNNVGVQRNKHTSNKLDNLLITHA